MITKIPAPKYEPDEKKENGLDKEDREKSYAAADAISECGFAWEETAEGYNFWQGVHNRLAAISRGESLK